MKAQFYIQTLLGSLLLTCSGAITFVLTKPQLLDDKGCLIGGFLGLISSVPLTVLPVSVWEAVLGNAKGSAPFPYPSPALFSMTIGFVGIWLFSILDNSERAKIDKAGFLAQQVRSETGIGAAAASGH